MKEYQTRLKTINCQYFLKIKTLPNNLQVNQIIILPNSRKLIIQIVMKLRIKNKMKNIFQRS